ncbi:hypothetical protein H9Y04_13055 [Streptomyces sp. TRM66268-LWL]|uniref:Uncharacterized protein n=1 Tax=Streptomyces polyasparticus TaxID=2767826 RepID=A0ABR7SF45_9ACTN|nr:hypothetical protein [Streptomyces polyasparticus]MBC9713499.1 hypothetical protein [Streptomyces polyasparticus]
MRGMWRKALQADSAASERAMGVRAGVLVEESERLGPSSETDSDLITSSLTEPQTPVGVLLIPVRQIASVPATAGLDEIPE